MPHSTSRRNYRMVVMVWCLIALAIMPNQLSTFGSRLGTVVAKSAVSSRLTTQTNITGPAGSEFFGSSLTALPNGNIVVTDPGFDITMPSVILNVGAVYLYNGATGTLISMLTGSGISDLVGLNGVTVLSSGNYVIASPNWDNGRGAVTWCNAATGVAGMVSAANSLVGSGFQDRVGSFRSVHPLTNGNYVVTNPFWDNGSIFDAGAATWANGATGVAGPVSTKNSLVGSSANNLVGGFGVTALLNGNYVVRSPGWDNDDLQNVGAVTWGNGETGITGTVSAKNSLIGSTANDLVGGNFFGGGVIALSNGNYVVGSPNWDNGPVINAGAATWGNGATGTIGAVSEINSLVGSFEEDNVSGGNNTFPGDGITALSNGNYVVRSPRWRNGTVQLAGAATWGNGVTVSPVPSP